MAGKFCVSIANSRKDPDKVTVGFVVANAALGSEKETMVFLSTDGVWAAVPGEAEKLNVGEPFAPLKELMDKFIAGGGKVLVCNPCLRFRSIDAEKLIPGAVAAGGAALVEFLADGTPCISY